MIKKISTDYQVINDETKEFIHVTVLEHSITILPRSSNNYFTFSQSSPARIKRIANLILEAAEIKF